MADSNNDTDPSKCDDGSYQNDISEEDLKLIHHLSWLYGGYKMRDRKNDLVYNESEILRKVHTKVDVPKRPSNHHRRGRGRPARTGKTLDPNSKTNNPNENRESKSDVNLKHVDDELSKVNESNKNENLVKLPSNNSNTNRSRNKNKSNHVKEEPTLNDTSTTGNTNNTSSNKDIINTNTSSVTNNNNKDTSNKENVDGYEPLTSTDYFDSDGCIGEQLLNSRNLLNRRLRFGYGYTLNDHRRPTWPQNFNLKDKIEYFISKKIADVTEFRSQEPTTLSICDQFALQNHEAMVADSDRVHYYRAAIFWTGHNNQCSMSNKPNVLDYCTNSNLESSLYSNDDHVINTTTGNTNTTTTSNKENDSNSMNNINSVDYNSNNNNNINTNMNNINMNNINDHVNNDNDDTYKLNNNNCDNAKVNDNLSDNKYNLEKKQNLEKIKNSEKNERNREKQLNKMNGYKSVCSLNGLRSLFRGRGNEANSTESTEPSYANSLNNLNYNENENELDNLYTGNLATNGTSSNISLYNDTVMNSNYNSSINSNNNDYMNNLTYYCSNKKILEIGTGPMCVLAMNAVKAGAKSVDALEVSVPASRLAGKLMAAYGFNNIIKVFNTHSKLFVFDQNEYFTGSNPKYSLAPPTSVTPKFKKPFFNRSNQNSFSSNSNNMDELNQNSSNVNSNFNNNIFSQENCNTLSNGNNKNLSSDNNVEENFIDNNANINNFGLRNCSIQKSSTDTEENSSAAKESKYAADNSDAAEQQQHSLELQYEEKQQQLEKQLQQEENEEMQNSGVQQSEQHNDNENKENTNTSVAASSKAATNNNAKENCNENKLNNTKNNDSSINDAKNNSAADNDVNCCTAAGSTDNQLQHYDKEEQQKLYNNNNTTNNNFNDSSMNNLNTMLQEQHDNDEMQLDNDNLNDINAAKSSISKNETNSSKINNNFNNLSSKINSTLNCSNYLPINSNNSSIRDYSNVSSYDKYYSKDDDYELTLPSDPPYDMVISEILGDFASQEGVADVFLDFQRRILFENKRFVETVKSIPCKASTMFVPSFFPDSSNITNKSSTDSEMTIFSPSKKMLQSVGMRIDNLPVCDEWLTLEHLDLEQWMLPQMCQHYLNLFKVSKYGQVAGLLLGIDVEIRPGEHFGTRYGQCESWYTNFLLFDDEYTVFENDLILVNSVANLTNYVKANCDGVKIDVSKPAYCFQVYILSPIEMAHTITAKPFNYKYYKVDKSYKQLDSNNSVNACYSTTNTTTNNNNTNDAQSTPNRNCNTATVSDNEEKGFVDLPNERNNAAQENNLNNLNCCTAAGSTDNQVQHYDKEKQQQLENQLQQEENEEMQFREEQKEVQHDEQHTDIENKENTNTSVAASSKAATNNNAKENCNENKLNNRCSIQRSSSNDVKNNSAANNNFNKSSTNNLSTTDAEQHENEQMQLDNCNLNDTNAAKSSTSKNETNSSNKNNNNFNNLSSTINNMNENNNAAIITSAALQQQDTQINPDAKNVFNLNTLFSDKKNKDKENAFLNTIKVPCKELMAMSYDIEDVNRISFSDLNKKYNTSSTSCSLADDVLNGFQYVQLNGNTYKVIHKPPPIYIDYHEQTSTIYYDTPCAKRKMHTDPPKRYSKIKLKAFK